MFNIDPKIWGHNAWEFLFYVAISYPNNPTNEEQNNMKNFLLYTGKILPCEKCRLNYIDHLKKYPLNEAALRDRNSLLIWLSNINNEIRVINNKEPLKTDKIIDRYINKNSCEENYKTNLIYILSILIIIFILIFFVKFKILN